MNRSEIIELLVLLTLWIEFAYDAWWNGREQRHKRASKRSKPQWESLTTGESK